MVGGRCVFGARWWCGGGWVGLVGASRVLAGRGSWGVSVVSVGGRRRVVSVGGVRGVLVVRGGRWVVSNESEVRVLEALRDEGGVLGRFEALAAALNEGVAAAGDLRRLNWWLSTIAASRELWRVRVPAELCAAVAFVCVCVDDERLSRWLEFALSARLNGCLVEGLLPGPGWESWSMPTRDWPRSFDRDAHWISELPQGFWDRLGAHRDERLRATAAASDPTARPKVLKELALTHQGVSAVADVVASNPRTPTRTLRHLMQYPGFHSRIELRVAHNRAVAAALLEEMSRSHDWETRYAVASHPNASPRALKRLGGDERVVVRCAAARAPKAPVAVLEALAADDEMWVRAHAASNRSVPPASLRALLGDRYAAVRAAAVSNAALAVELTAECVGDRAKGVRAAVAERLVDPEVLAVLATDPKREVRLAVGYNASTPPGVLGVLAGDSCGEVRAAAAGQRATPLWVLGVLAGDDYWWVRYSLATNTSAPAETLWTLAGDEDPAVSAQAAQHAAMSPQRLQTLAAHDDRWLRGAVALNTAASSELLEALADDDDSEVRRCVCDNDRAPECVVDALRSDPDYWVRAAAAAASASRRRHDQTAADVAAPRR